MERFSTCELRDKEVINICDGTRMGCPCDFEFNVYKGAITALIVPRSCGFLGLNRAQNIVIPWERVECIGTDAILVRIAPDEKNNGDNKKRGQNNCK